MTIRSVIHRPPRHRAGNKLPLRLWTLQRLQLLALFRRDTTLIGARDFSNGPLRLLVYTCLAPEHETAVGKRLSGVFGKPVYPWRAGHIIGEIDVFRV